MAHVTEDFFRDNCATLTSTELVIGESVYPLAEIHSARAFRRRKFVCWPFRSFALAITTSSEEWEVLCHRNAYVIFQLEKAIDTALREARHKLAKSA